MSIGKRPDALLRGYGADARLSTSDAAFRCSASDVKLFERLSVELGEGIVFHGETYFYRMAADFAIFDVSLARDGSVQHHGDFFAAVGTIERVFHIQTVQYFRAE
jgi:hypothetical protein